MASASCASVIPQDTLAQPALTAVHGDELQSPAASTDIDDESEAEGPDASDATDSPHDEVDAPHPLAENAQSAAGRLSLAFQMLGAQHHRVAAKQFQSAIDTGELNDAGRALAYWHVALTHRSLGELSDAQEALQSFVTVAVDILTVSERNPQPVDPAADFITRFDLRRRVARARAELSAAWAEHTAAFGRSLLTPVPVHNEAEMHYFLELAPACPEGHTRQTFETHLTQAQTAKGLAQVQLLCSGNQIGAHYYFVVVAGN